MALLQEVFRQRCEGSRGGSRGPRSILLTVLGFGPQRREPAEQITGPQGGCGARRSASDPGSLGRDHPLICVCSKPRTCWPLPGWQLGTWEVAPALTVAFSRHNDTAQAVRCQPIHLWAAAPGWKRPVISCDLVSLGTSGERQ